MRDFTPNTWTSRVTITELDPKLCHFLPPELLNALQK